MEDLLKKTKAQLIEEILSLRDKVKELENNNSDSVTDIDQRFIDQLDKNPAAMVIHSDGKILYSNKSTNELIGVENSDEVIGKDVIDFVHPDSKINNLKRIEELLKEKKTGEFSQEVFLKKDGTPFHVVVKGFPIEYKKKQAVLVEFWDITKNKNFYDALKESKKHYKTLLDSIEASVFMLDLDMKYVSGNKILYDRLEVKETDILGKNIKNILAEKTAKEFLKNAQVVLKTKKSVTFDIDVNAVAGEATYHIKMSPVFDDDGNVVNILGISNDITVQKKAVNEMIRDSEKFQYLVEQADDAIFKGDSAGNFIYVNPAAVYITGFSKEKLLKMNMSDLFNKKELSDKPLKYDLLDEGRSILMIRDIIIKDGSTIRVEMNSKKMQDGTYICIMRDISGRKM